MEQLTFDLLSHPDFNDRAKEFYNNYDLVKVTVPGDPNLSKRSLQRSSERTCIFCNRTHPATTFSNYSHLVPQLMGNKDLYSDFECDKCNEKFSLFENDLAEFLGVSRSVTGVFGSARTLGFKARKLRTKSRSFIGDNILIIAPEDLRREGEKTTISYTKNPYVPANVYKALLKSALSLLGKSEIIQNYPLAIEYLVGKKVLQQGASISGYRLSFLINLPLHIYHFKKRIPNEKVPTDVMIFNFQNHIIALPIFLHNKDMATNYDLYNVVIPPPYFFDQATMAKAMPVSFMTDLYSTEKVTDDEESLSLVLDPESLKNSVSYNPETQKIERTENGNNGIKYLILTKGNVTIDPKAFSTFIKEQTEGTK